MAKATAELLPKKLKSRQEVKAEEFERLLFEVLVIFNEVVVVVVMIASMILVFDVNWNLLLFFFSLLDTVISTCCSS